MSPLLQDIIWVAQVIGTVALFFAVPILVVWFIVLLVKAIKERNWI